MTVHGIVGKHDLNKLTCLTLDWIRWASFPLHFIDLLVLLSPDIVFDAAPPQFQVIWQIAEWKSDQLNVVTNSELRMQLLTGFNQLIIKIDGNRKQRSQKTDNKLWFSEMSQSFDKSSNRAQMQTSKSLSHKLSIVAISGETSTKLFIGNKSTLMICIIIFDSFKFTTEIPESSYISYNLKLAEIWRIWWRKTTIIYNRESSWAQWILINSYYDMQRTRRENMMSVDSLCLMSAEKVLAGSGGSTCAKQVQVLSTISSFGQFWHWTLCLLLNHNVTLSLNANWKHLSTY